MSAWISGVVVPRHDQSTGILRPLHLLYLHDGSGILFGVGLLFDLFITAMTWEESDEEDQKEYDHDRQDEEKENTLVYWNLRRLRKVMFLLGAGIHLDERVGELSVVCGVWIGEGVGQPPVVVPLSMLALLILLVIVRHHA